MDGDVLRLEQRLFPQLLQRQKTRPKPVIDIVIIVSNSVHQVRDLCLETGLLAFEKAFANVTKLTRIAHRAVLEYAFTGFKHQVESRKLGVLGLQVINDAQGLQVVFKTTVVAHAGIQRILPGMAERRVAKIVRKADRLGQGFVKLKSERNRTSDLRYL